MKAIVLGIMMIFGFVACDKTAQDTPAQDNATKPQTTSALPYKATSVTINGDRLSISDSLGDIEITKNPAKVVVFDFGALDTLDAWGLGSVVIGAPIKALPAYLSHFSDKASVGSLIEPNLESINELKPDLIIISGRQAKFYDKLREIAPVLFVSIDNAHFMESFANKVESLAAIWGKEIEAKSALDALNDQAQRIKDSISTEKRGLILLTNANRMSAFGSHSRFGIIHDVLGIPVVDENIKVGTHGNIVNAEYVADKNPDFIFVVDRNVIVGNQERAQGVLDNALVAKTNAAQNGKIIYLNPEYWYLSGGGLVSFKAMIEEIENAVK